MRDLLTGTTFLEVAGAVAIGYGLHQAWPPAGWLWVGLCCFGMSYVLQVSEVRRTGAGPTAVNDENAHQGEGRGNPPEPAHGNRFGG